MPTYLDVGVVRIQKYLTRSADLKGRRGASSLVATHTAVSAVQKEVPSVQPNLGLGDADGVVHLEVKEGFDAEVAAYAVLSYLSVRLPAAELEASWATADTYSAAYPELASMRETLPLRVLPSLMDVPLVQRCDGCAQAGATSKSGKDWLCSDCSARITAAGTRQIKKGAIGIDAEERLLDELNSGTRALTGPTTFEALAELGTDLKKNHLATVFIDGNGIGKWFEYVGKNSPAQYTNLSTMVTEVTKKALMNAAVSVQRHGSILATIPHVVGGDDVLVTVPASHAWAFTIEFLDTFGREIGERIGASELNGSGLDLPSVSAGIVIAKTAFPFSDAVSIASGLLKRAKTSNSGSRAAVCWLDVTRHGSVIPDWRKPRSLEWLIEHRDDLSSLSKMDQSALATFRAMSEVTDAGNSEASIIAKQSRRVNLTHLSPLLQPSSGEEVSTLADALDISRWWESGK